jgi:hypothetical protein
VPGSTIYGGDEADVLYPTTNATGCAEVGCASEWGPFAFTDTIT